VDRGLTPNAMRRGEHDGDGRLPNARLLGETSLTFLVHHTIDEASMRRYAMAARDCIASVVAASRVSAPEAAATPP
jgi:hypothetical protein